MKPRYLVRKKATSQYVGTETTPRVYTKVGAFQSLQPLCRVDMTDMHPAEAQWKAFPEHKIDRCGLYGYCDNPQHRKIRLQRQHAKFDELFELVEVAPVKSTKPRKVPSK